VRITLITNGTNGIPSSYSPVSLGFRAFIDPPGSGTVSVQSFTSVPSSQTLPGLASLAGVSASSGDTLSLLNALLGAVSNTATSPNASVASGAPSGQVLTVSNMTGASDSTHPPAPVSSGFFSLQVYKSVAEAGGSVNAGSPGGDLLSGSILDMSILKPLLPAL